MNSTDWFKAMVIAAALAVIAVTFAGAIVDKANCEAKGGKRLRGTWVWEGGFKCYDAKTLREIPPATT